jgi:hypothetical protein
MNWRGDNGCEGGGRGCPCGSPPAFARGRFGRRHGFITGKVQAESVLQLDVPKHYADYDELLRDPEIESVHICTPKKMHYEMTRNALLAGNHVVCEKPLTVSIEEAEELKGRILPERSLPGSGK